MNTDGNPSPPLLAPPTAEQLLMIETIGKVFLQHQEWPGWAYIEEQMERERLSAEAVLASMPREYAHQYGYVWPVRQSAPLPENRVGLTVAGISHVPGAQRLVETFLGLVDALGTIRSEITLDPFSDTRPIVTRAQVLVGRAPTLVFEQVVLRFLEKEPSTWHCQVTPLPDDDWKVELSPVIRRFAGVDSIDDYLGRVRDLVGGSQPPGETDGFVSPFTLPAAFDYLDVVCRLRFGDALVVPPGVERSSRLAFDATTPEEADSRLSALAELLKGLRVPGVPGVSGGHPLGRLDLFLTSQLSPEVHERISQAVDTLRAARSMRAGAQHSGARAEVVEAHRQLGLPFPVANWPTAWAQIQREVTKALDAIRDEIQAATPPQEAFDS